MNQREVCGFKYILVLIYNNPEQIQQLTDSISSYGLLNNNNLTKAPSLT